MHVPQSRDRELSAPVDKLRARRRSHASCSTDHGDPLPTHYNGLIPHRGPRAIDDGYARNRQWPGSLLSQSQQWRGGPRQEL